MLDEIHSFLEALRKPPEWPKNLPALEPFSEEELRAESEENWRLVLAGLDRIEAGLVELYEAGAEDGKAVELLDQVMSIIRRKTGSRDARLREIGHLLRTAGKAWPSASP